MIPSGNPNNIDQLPSTAQIVSTELAYGRSLAMANNSNYIFTFDIANNSFTLQHSGTNTSLNQLPNTPFSSSSDTKLKHIIYLNKLPHVGPTVQLAAVIAGAVESVGNLEFNALGATTRTEATVVWLAVGSGTNRRYISILVDPVVGLCRIGNYSITAPQ